MAFPPHLQQCMATPISKEMHQPPTCQSRTNILLSHQMDRARMARQQGSRMTGGGLSSTFSSHQIQVIRDSSSTAILKIDWNKMKTPWIRLGKTRLIIRRISEVDKSQTRQHPINTSQASKMKSIRFTK